jgi:hypothetical protein
VTIIVQTRDEPTCSVENCALPESCHFYEHDRWIPHRFKSAPGTSGQVGGGSQSIPRPSGGPGPKGADDQEGWDVSEVGGMEQP